MKSKKGGNKKGKKGGGGGKKKGGGGKKPPQQPPRADEEAGVVIPKGKKELTLIPGFGCMVTKAWSEAVKKNHVPLMVEIARTNMQRHFDKVTDAQSKASLLHILGHSLMKTFEKEATKEGTKCQMEALQLIRSMGERSVEEIVYGVWPEDCLDGWNTLLMQLDPSERNKEMEWIQEMISLTRLSITLWQKELDKVNALYTFSHGHYSTEFKAISDLSTQCFSALSEEDVERWLVVFEKRIKVIKAIFEQEGWDLDRVKHGKSALLKSKCDLYERQGKPELALDMINQVFEEEGEDVREKFMLYQSHIELGLKMGRFEEALNSMEKVFSLLRMDGAKSMAAQTFKFFLTLVARESRPLFAELLPQYPHVVWAASAAGLAVIPEEQKKMWRNHLQAKSTLLCVNCSKELTKIYRCSRCNAATYCGSACQKEAWKEHKKICKKRE
jgi:tetratricopeptide (TPR) repeat protein